MPGSPDKYVRESEKHNRPAAICPRPFFLDSANLSGKLYHYHLAAQLDGRRSLGHNK